MSQATVTAEPLLQKPGRSSSLWKHQILAILALELRKTLLGRRSLPMYFLALMPVAIFVMRAVLALLVTSELTEDGMGGASTFFAAVFQSFMLRFAIFFGCVAVFTNLFRGEVVDRSLHYYFLSPVRREVLAVGKYLSGLVSTAVIFTGMTILCYFLLYLPHGFQAGWSYFFGGPGLGHLLAYISATLLACAGYGAVFLAIGLLFRNPVIPAAAILGWEMIYFLLPSLLKKISVVHYVISLCPVPVDMGPFALIVEPTPAWIGVPGLILFSSVLVGISALITRRTQIIYGKE